MRAAMLAQIFLAVSCGLSGSRVSEPVDLPAPVEGRLDAQPWFVPFLYMERVVDAAYEVDAPVWILARLFEWESGWNEQYVGKVNRNGTTDYGLAGLNSGSLEDFQKYNDDKAVDPFDAWTSIRIGSRYLAALRGETGSWREAVRRYAGRRPEAHVSQIMGGAQ